MDEQIKPDKIRSILKQYGFTIINSITGLGPYYIVKPVGNRKFTVNKRSFINVLRNVNNDKNVEWIRKQIWYERDPRHQKDSDSIPVKGSISIQDPSFYKQWYLNNLGQLDGIHKLDIGVTSPWSKGYDGTGIVVAVLDDGLNYNNKDLVDNYDQTASYDFIDYDNDPLPDSSRSSYSHGTRCAGVIAAAKNGFCGVGVAYNVSIGGIRMLNTKTTDSIEASALSYQSDYIDIYSCNWGPRDDGVRFGRPGPLTVKALRVGASKGRRSLGSIFVWSSGNGGLYKDDCNADGYITSIYTIAIGAISNNGTLTAYSESCASVLAVTFSGSTTDAKFENKFVTTDSKNECIENFPGTSASASLATGIIALTLQANPLLTWRDVQHLIVDTSVITNPTDFGWTRNAAGKWFNHLYGFGRLDATILVDRAFQWENVAAQQKCKSEPNQGPWSISKGSTIILSNNITKCYENDEYKQDNSIKRLEHVQLITSITHSCRGRLSVELISPSGTRSVLLKPRLKDHSSHGIHEWVFTSVHFWGEDSVGLWTAIISDDLTVDPCLNSMKGKNISARPSLNSLNSSKEKKIPIEQDSLDITSPPPSQHTTESAKNSLVSTTIAPEVPKIKKEKNDQQTAKNFDHHFTNDSMIERIVVEKYRMMPNSHTSTIDERGTSGDIKVIINNLSKRNRHKTGDFSSDKRKLNDISEEILNSYTEPSTDNSFEDINDMVADDEELWNQELDDSESKYATREERTTNRFSKGKNKSSPKNISKKNKVKKKSLDEDTDLISIIGIVKFWTLVLYGT